MKNIEFEINPTPSLEIGFSNPVIGGGGTYDYDGLRNKPMINGVTLEGDKSTDDLLIVMPSKTSELENDSGFITEEETITDEQIDALFA